MKVEFELFEEHEGRIIIAEPIGWKEAVASLGRDKDFYSLIESFSSPLKLWGINGANNGGRDWVINVRKKWGVNARITGKIWYNPHNLLDPVSQEVEVTEVTPITIPDLVDWLTRSVSGPAIDWTEGAVPEVTLPGGGPFDTRSSELIYTDYAFVEGRQYTINVTSNSVYNSGNSNPRNISLKILDAAFNVLFQQAEATPITPGGAKVISITFVATAACVHIGVDSTQGSNVTLTLTAKSGTQEITTIQNTAGNKLLFEGQLPILAMTDILDKDYTTQTTWTPIGLWADFLKRFSTAVDISSPTALDGRDVELVTPSISLPLPSQVLKRKTTYEGPLDEGIDITNEDYVKAFPTGGDLITENFTTYGQGVVELRQNEILNSFSGLLFNIDSATVPDVAPALLISAEESGDLKIFLKPDAKLSGGLRGAIFANDLDPTQNEIIAIDLNVQLLAVKNAEAPVLLGAGAASLGGIANPNAPLTQRLFNLTFGDLTLTSFEETIAVVPGDEIRVYLQYFIQFTADVNTEQQIEWTERVLYIDAYNSIVEFSFDSIYPATVSPAYLLHDVGYGILDRILQRDKVFYSERLGNLKTCRAYDAIGADSEYAITKFLQLRGYSLTEKKPFISFETWWKGANPLFNLGLGFIKKQVDGTLKTVIEVEEKQKFFDDSAMSIILLNVKNIERSYDQELYFNEAGFGINKGEPEDLQGVDDPKKHYWTSLFNGIGKKFEIFTEFIFQSMTIESARRKRATKSTDYKYDDDVAIVSLVEDVDGNYTPRIDEGFSAVTGLENSDSRYNKKLTPGRIFLRWKNFVSCCLQDYPASLFRSGAGEGNYAMASTMDDNGQPESYGGNSLGESDHIVVGEDFLFQPIPYKIKNHPITFEQYQFLLENKKLAIGVSQTDSNPVAFFIWDLQAKLFKGTMDLTVYPKYPFDLIKVANPLPPSTYIFDDSFARGAGGFNEQA